MTEQTAPLVVKRTDDFSNSFFKELHNLQQSNQLTDFTVTVKDKCFNCHRVVLAAACPYFAALFSSRMAETEKNEVSLNHLDGEVLNLLINYCYNGEISVPWNAMKPMIESVELLQLSSLKNIVTESIPGHLTSTNCIGWYKFSDKYNMSSVAAAARKIMLNDFELVTKCEEFLALPLAEVIDYINDEGLALPNSDALLQACMVWTTTHEDREIHLSHVITHIDLDKCTYDCLDAVISRYCDLLEKVDRKTERMLLRACSKKGRSQSSAMTHPDDDEQKLIIVSGWDDTGRTQEAEIRLLTDTSAIVNTIPKEFLRMYQSVCQSDEGLYLLGGSVNGCDQFVRYSITDKNWVQLESLPQGKYYIASVCIENELYCIGGQDNGRSTNTMSIYSEVTQARTEGGLMPCKPLFPLALSTSTSYIYVIDRSEKSFVLVYSVTAKKWGTPVSFPDGCTNGRGCAAAAKDNYLYMFGDQLTQTLQYDTILRTWVLLKMPRLSHWWGSAIYFHDKIWLVGGDCDEIETYDIEKDVWEVLDIKCHQKLRFHKVLPWKY